MAEEEAEVAMAEPVDALSEIGVQLPLRKGRKLKLPWNPLEERETE